MQPRPRVRCGACAFEWFGATAAHGLRIVGSCTRCGGELEFLVADEDTADPDPLPDALGSVSPAAVLGLPTRWLGR